MYEELIRDLRSHLDKDWRLQSHLNKDKVSKNLRDAADAIEHLCEACANAHNELANVIEELEQIKIKEN